MLAKETELVGREQRSEERTPLGGLVSQPRIVSLLASATETIWALGLGQFLVGRSHECDYPPEVKRLPVLTGPRIDVSGSSRDIDEQVRRTVSRGEPVYWVNAELLRALRPTVIVTQDHCEVCAVSLRDVERAIQAVGAAPTGSAAEEVSCGGSRTGWETPSLPGTCESDEGSKPRDLQEGEWPRIVALKPHRLADVWEGMLAIGAALGVEEKARELIRLLVRRMEKAAPAGIVHRPTVVCLEWLDPLMGAGNWMPELVALAGGVSVLDEAGKPSSYLRYDELQQVDPEVIVILPCGWDLPRTRSELDALNRLPGWHHLYAVRHRRVYLTDGNQYFNRPGPRLAESVEILAEILHPDRLALRYRGQAWEPVY